MTGLDVRHIRFRHLPSAGESGKDLRERIKRAELLRHLSEPPGGGRLVLFSTQEVLWASLDELHDQPGAGTALARSLLDEEMVLRAFRTGREEGRLVVLEVLEHGGWWLATCPEAGEAEWTETEGSGPLPEVIRRWRPLAAPPPDLRIVAHRQVGEGSIQPVGREPAPVDDGWRSAIEALVPLLSNASADEALAFSVSAGVLAGWSIPPRHLGGLDEAMRAIALATGAEMVGAVRIPIPTAEAPTGPVAEVLIEEVGHRRTVLLGMVDGDVLLLDHHDLGPISPGDGWLERPPSPVQTSVPGWSLPSA